MGVRRPGLRLLLTLALVLLAVLLAGCETKDPQNTFSPVGDVADDQRDLFNLVLWPAVVILILVEGLLVVALLRFRRRSPDELPKQVHGNTRLELAWTIAPALLLMVLAVPTVASIVELGRAPSADALKVTAIGQQWVWSFQYPDYKDAQGNVLTVFGTPEELPEMHIPPNLEIAVQLQSADVIHSFWVPKLAGKTDAIPGRNNRMWLIAREPGTYSGQCAEFCGLAHAEMRFVVVVHENMDDFQQWVDDQLSEEAAAPGTSGPVAGRYGE